MMYNSCITAIIVTAFSLMVFVPLQGQELSELKDDIAEFKVNDSILGVKHTQFAAETALLIKYLKALEQKKTLQRQCPVWICG